MRQAEARCPQLCACDGVHAPPPFRLSRSLPVSNVVAASVSTDGADAASALRLARLLRVARAARLFKLLRLVKLLRVMNKFGQQNRCRWALVFMCGKHACGRS